MVLKIEMRNFHENSTSIVSSLSMVNIFSPKFPETLPLLLAWISGNFQPSHGSTICLASFCTTAFLSTNFGPSFSCHICQWNSFWLRKCQIGTFTIWASRESTNLSGYSSQKLVSVFMAILFKSVSSVMTPRSCNRKAHLLIELVQRASWSGSPKNGSRTCQVSKWRFVDFRDDHNVDTWDE